MDSSTFLFILGYFVNILATLYLGYTVQKDRHIEGLSFQTQIIYAVAMIAKIFYFTLTTLSEHWFGWLEMILSLVSTGYVLFLFWKYRKLSFATESKFTITYLTIPICLILSVFMHPGFVEDGFDFASMMIAFGSFLEAAAFVPQLLIIKKEGHVKRSMGIYIVLVCISRVCRVLFWLALYFTEGGYFWTIILSDLIYIVMVADLIYYFYKYKHEMIIPFN